MSARIARDSLVEFHFEIKLADGSVAESTRAQNKPARLQMGDGSLTEGFEACLLDLAEGSKEEFTLPPESTFGPVNPDNIFHLDRHKFSDMNLEVGHIVAFTGPDGSEMPGMIREIAGESVTVDFNHPLAGQTLTFAVEILAVNPEG